VNWLDRAVGYVWPEAGVRRARARAAMSLARSYDAAKTGRRTDGWRSAGTSANAEVTPSLAAVRNRARELVRNNPHALRAVNILAAKSIGTGIRARWDKGAQAAWKEFEQTCDFEGDQDLYGLQSLIARASFESGECLVRRVRQTSGRVPLKLQVLESDYIDSNKFGKLSNGNMVIAGVEVDALGRKAAFWLYPSHPGETGLQTLISLHSTRVPATEIILLGEKLRPGQLRYMPRLAAAMMRMRDFDDYRDALIVKKKIEACFAAFVIGGTPSVPLGEATTDSTTNLRTETLSPGIIEYVNGGQDVKFANPSTGSDDGFSGQELHAIAAGAGVTYEQLTGDLSGVNYSSIRSGMLDFRDLVEAWRWTHFMPMVMRRIGDWFLDAAWTAGTIRTQNYSAVWTPPKWPWVDPLKDVEAARMEMRAGLASLSEKVRELGYDPEEVFAEIGEERKKLKDAAIVVDSNAEVPSSGGASGGVASATSASEPPDDSGKQALDAMHADVRALLARKPEPVVVNNTVNVPERQTTVENHNHVAPAAAEVRVENHIAPAQVEVPVHVRAYPRASTETIERDANHDMTRITRANED